MYSSTSMSEICSLASKVQDFLVRQLQAGFVRHHVPAAEGFELAAVAVDAHADVDIAFIAFFRGLRQREFEGAEDDLFIDIFFARQRINQQQNFATHALRLLKSTFGTSRALSSSASVNSNNAAPSLPSISKPIFSPSGACRMPVKVLRFAAAGHRHAQLDRAFVTGEALEVGQGAHRTVQSGRRHFQALVVHVFDREQVRQLVAHRGAILDRDRSLFVRHRRREVDEHAQDASLGTLDIDQVVTQSTDCRGNQIKQLHSSSPPVRCRTLINDSTKKKWATAHLSIPNQRQLTKIRWERTRVRHQL
jgi:hypothetical protein